MLINGPMRPIPIASSTDDDTNTISSKIRLLLAPERTYKTLEIYLNTYFSPRDFIELFDARKTSAHEKA
jgi:hypothetical protein